MRKGLRSTSTRQSDMQEPRLATYMAYYMHASFITKLENHICMTMKEIFQLLKLKSLHIIEWLRLVHLIYLFCHLTFCSTV